MGKAERRRASGEDMVGGVRRVFYRGKEFLVLPGVYEPAEDTFLLADHLEVGRGERVLELGTGCGILAVLAAERGGRVLATDVSERALRCAWLNAWRHGVRVELRRGNLFEPVGDSRFELIIFNPPYLPEEENPEENPEGDHRWSGGADGRRVLDPFLSALPSHLSPGGRALFVQSSLSGVEETLRRVRGVRILSRLKLSFEELLVMEVRMEPF